MRVVVLVPRRADKGRRDELWAWVKARWQTEHPDWDIVEGAHNGTKPFNRSLAINRAAVKAGDWDVAVVADADSFVGTHQSTVAVDTALQSGQMTMAYTRWCALDQAMSDRIMNGFTGNWWPGVFVSAFDTCSSMFAVPRTLFDTCEGFDTGIAGWGCEDIIFAHKARTFGNGWQRLAGECWHLYHESAPRPTIDSNVARADRYHAAAGNPTAMRALIAELR